MKKISITIMAHPDRIKYIPYLKSKLGDVPIIFDKKNNIWDTCRRAWLAHDLNSEYSLVLQDDVIICDDFLKKLKLKLTDDVIYCLYVGEMMKSRIDKAIKNNQHYFDSGMIFNEVAICMKTKHIENMVKYCDESGTDLDHEISNWAKRKGLKIRNLVPSLVDHRPDTQSIFRKNYNLPQLSKPRIAYKYEDNEK